MVDVNRTIFFLNRQQEEQHAKDRAARLGIPYIDLAGYPLVKEVLDIIPVEKVVLFQVIPYLKIGDSVKIGVVDPQKPEVIAYLKELETSTKRTFTTTLISRSSLFYGASFYEKYRKQAIEAKEAAVPKDDESNLNITDLKSAAEAARKVNTTKLLETILLGGIKLNSSDIHFEPSQDSFLTRYRVDGVLQDVVSLPLPQYKQLVSRVKFLSKLRMDIVDKPQDGRFSFSFSPTVNIDLRVSIMPSSAGESIVLRLLGQEKEILQLDKLGFRSDAQTVIREAISKPHGMILTSGPTGAGKSSTLYALLMELKKPGVKIITLEDPVEYKIDGIEQSQVQPDKGYTFADGLRASLRQDPDILMVGEIRDLETAEIAVQAALTGHLLLSTIHANTAPAVYARLLEIGVKPFLLSGSINLIMAQRLVRKICPDCAQKYQPKPEIWQNVLTVLTPIKAQLSPEVVLKLDSPTPELVHGVGCGKCNQTGFIGRQVIVEILIPNDTVEALIAKSASISEFEKAAAAMGMVTMEQDGLAKALVGETTIDEVWRVTKG